MVQPDMDLAFDTTSLICFVHVRSLDMWMPRVKCHQPAQVSKSAKITKIFKKKNIRDLGIHISNDLTWTKQINEVVSKARSMLGWTMRTFQTRERVPISTIWNSLVRPCLDYYSQLWSPNPSNLREIDFLEETYRSFTRQI